MKAVLVINMPSRCGNCPLFHGEIPKRCMVDSKHRCVGAPYDMDVPCWCPLRPLPEKKTYNDDIYEDWMMLNSEYNKGWNECIDEIIGDE